jgi:predicted transcriptional regulator
MGEYVNTSINLAVSLETNRKLDLLKAHLNSPKSWIIRRLVDQETESKHKHKVEVRA